MGSTNLPLESWASDYGCVFRDASAQGEAQWVRRALTVFSTAARASPKSMRVLFL
jgi:hypothetical protein